MPSHPSELTAHDCLLYLQGGHGIYALRPWSAQAPKAVQCLVEHLRQSFAPGFPGIQSKRLAGNHGVKNATDNLAP